MGHARALLDKELLLKCFFTEPAYPLGPPTRVPSLVSSSPGVFPLSKVPIPVDDQARA